MLTIRTYDNLTKEAIEEAIKQYNNPKSKQKPRNDDYNFDMSFNSMIVPRYSFITVPQEIKDYNNRYLFFYFYEESDCESRGFIKQYGGKLNNILDSIHLFTVYDSDDFDNWGEVKGKAKLKEKLVEFEGDYRNNRYNKLKEIGDSYGVNRYRYPALLLYDIETKKQSIKYYNGNTSAEIYSGIKEIVNDINENYGNIDLDKIGSVTFNTNISNYDEDFLDLYEKYAKRVRGSKNLIAGIFDMDYSTLYRRMNSYNLYSLFDRDEIIMMSIIFKLTKFEANDFLASYHKSRLDDGDKRDHFILDGIECKHSIDKINDKLRAYGIEELTSTKKKRTFDE